MDDSVITKYLSTLDEADRTELERIRKIVEKNVPEAIGVISYGMPGFKYKNQYLLGFAAFKDHLSIFPTSGPIEDLKGKLRDYKTSKGTIQFNKDKPLPELLIKEIIKHRLKNIK